MIADLRSLPRAFWVLFAGTFINRFGTFVWPFLTIYLTRQGYSLARRGVGDQRRWRRRARAAASLGGWLADHIGRRQHHRARHVRRGVLA